MKKLKLLFASILLLPLVSNVMVYAVEDSGTSTQEVTTSESGDDSGDPKTEGASERLEAIKLKRTEKLAKTEEAKIKANCKAAQGKITAAQARFSEVRTNRKNIYKGINEKLANLVEKLKAGGIDTTALTVALEAIKVKVEEFSSLASSYEQTLADVAVMDCASDPEGFKDALESARSDRELLVAKADELKDYIKTTLKPILNELKTQLESSSGDSTQEGAN